MKPHEAPWLALSLTTAQCGALVEDGAVAAGLTPAARNGLASLCRSLDR